MEVHTHTSSWYVSDVYLPKIGLLNSIKTETGDTKVSLPHIDDDSFNVVFELVTCNLTMSSLPLPLERVIDVIHLCDFLQCKELLHILCMSVAGRLEESEDDTLDAFKIMWEQKQMLIK